MKIVERENYEAIPLFSRLLSLAQIPERLYIEGDIPEVAFDEYGIATPRILTVVGSRKHSTYGKDVIEKLIKALEGQQVIILSGLALGIDGLAHKYALTHHIKTIAVPGSGLSRKVIYPKAHLHLADEIVKSGGALFSELPQESESSPWSFPSRNRIMAALSDAVLIIEAEEKSGTLITARQALELGKDIGVVPGNIFSSTSKGTNALAKDGAHIIASSEDLYDLLHLTYEKKDASVSTELSLTSEESAIMNLLTEPKHKDILLMESNLSTPLFLMALSSLEIKGYIQETLGEVRKVV